MNDVRMSVIGVSGRIQFFARNTAPSGWLACTGQAVSRTTYSSLFGVIGTAFGGGDGSTTFNVPDLRGRFLRCWDNARGIDSGRVQNSAQDSIMQEHSHRIDVNRNLLYAGGGGRANDAPDLDDAFTLPVGGATDQSQPFGDTETRPVNYALLPCIKI